MGIAIPLHRRATAAGLLLTVILSASAAACGSSDHTGSWPPAVRAGHEPAFIVRVSEELLGRKLPTDFRRRSIIETSFGGMPVVAHAETAARVKLDLVDGGGQARFRILLDGTTTARTLSRDGSIRVSNSLGIHFSARKDVALLGGQLVGGPVELECRTQLKPAAIESKRRGLSAQIAEQVALRRLDERREELNRSAQEAARRELQREVDLLLDELLDVINVGVWASRMTLPSIAIRPQVATTDDRLEISFGHGKSPRALTAHEPTRGPLELRVRIGALSSWLLPRGGLEAAKGGHPAAGANEWLTIRWEGGDAMAELPHSQTIIR